MLEYSVAVAVERQRNAPALDQALQQREVASGVLADAKHGVDHGAAGVVHRQQQGEFGASVLQPGVMAAVQLDQHPRLGHPLAAETVLRRAPTAGTADARFGENAPHRGPAQVDALAFAEQFGEVGVVGAFVAAGGQFHHGGSLGRRDGIVGTAAAVAVGQRRRAMLPVGRQHPAGVAWGYAQHLGGLGDGHLVFQNGVQHGKSGLFFLVQRNVLHGKDIFADQLLDDRIVDQQHFAAALDTSREEVKRCAGRYFRHGRQN